MLNIGITLQTWIDILVKFQVHACFWGGKNVNFVVTYVFGAVKFLNGNFVDIS